MERRTISPSFEEKAETVACFFFRHTQRAKSLALNILAMNTDRAGAQLCAVEHQVISQRADLTQRRLGITGRVETGFELSHVLIVQRSEGVMRCVPALALPVPLEHVEIGDPEETEVLCGIAGLDKSPMLRCVFLSK